MAFDREFQQLLLTSKMSILSRTKNSLTNSSEFKRLLALLQSYSNNVGAELFAIVLDMDYLSKLDFTQINDNLHNNFTPELQLKNHFLVNEKFEFLSTSRLEFDNSNDARVSYSEISRNDKCVLISGKRLAYPHYFVEGEDVGNATFFTEADYKKFRELRDIGEVLEVIEDFRNELNHYSIYANFFVPKANLKTLFGDDKAKNNYKGKANVLRNRPEDHLRQALKNYLNNNINRSFNFFRETNMDNSSRRLDIIGEDERGNIYFFEVKWMGKSIGADEIKITTEYAEEKIIQGTEQTLKYIQEWQNNKRIVKLGCLVVFDARDDKYNYETATFKKGLLDNLSKYPTCSPKFRKIEDLKVDNKHPS